MIWRQAALIVVVASWVLFGIAFVVLFTGVRRRRRETAEQQERSLRAPAWIYGLVLQFVGGAIVFVVRRPPAEIPSAALLAACVLAPASAFFAAAAIRELDLQFRLKAVVSEDHRLVRSGPYSLVRHPIYLALFGVVMATGLVLSTPIAMLIAAALYLAGTEIRVRAEEGILARRFGREFGEYRRRVPAYLPFVR